MPSVSKKQHNLMAAVANNPAFAKKVGISQSVGKEFMKADKRKGKKYALGGPTKYAADDSDDGMQMSTRRMPSDSDSSMSFKDAFRTARKAGDDTFTWKGKKYTTELAGSSKPAAAASPKVEVEKTETKIEAPVRRPTAIRGRGAPGTREFDKQYAENRRSSYLDRVNPFSGINLKDLFGMREQERVMRDFGVTRTEARRRLNALEDVQEREGMRHGGKVKKYKSGGSVSSASKRADGIATKGKTRGKFV